jgi:HPt (histidine-containing phosphotransfer) domain-containing protein
MGDQRDVATEKIRRDSVQVKIAGHRLALPASTIIASALAALGTAYEVVRRDRAAVIERIEAVECLVDKLDHQREIADVRQFEVAASLARIETQLAELRSELLRRARQ